MTPDERRARWRERLDAQRGSGLSIPAWCAEQGLREATFYYWRKRLAAPATTSPAALPQWLALDTASSGESGVTLHIGAVAITVTAGFDPRVLAAVVRAVTPCSPA